MHISSWRSRRSFTIVAALTGGALLATGVTASALSSHSTKRPAVAQTTGNLPSEKIILGNAIGVNLDHHSVTLPLHRGEFNGTTVWYIITEASDAGFADELGLNYAPKLANLTAVDKAVQDVTVDAPAGNKFGSGIVHFQGIPDFSPTRTLVAGPTGFPPASATPGAVGDALYSPFIRIKGTSAVYNAPIVATGDGPFDVVHHTNTHDRALKINLAKAAGPGQFYGDSIELLDITGFDSGKPIVYLSTDASDPGAAVLERSTFVPALQNTPYNGGDDFLGSARERIFPFLNGQTGRNNPQAQGLAHLILDGHASEDASLSNTGLIEALRHNGDALNVQGDFPTLDQHNRQASYSPLWEAQFGEWTQKAVKAGLNKRMTDEFEILHLAATRPDLLTGPGGSAYGSSNVLINCPVIAFLETAPKADRIQPLPGDAVDAAVAYQQ